jgi:DNA-binding GntR family transcriptional regulator
VTATPVGPDAAGSPPLEEEAYGALLDWLVGGGARPGEPVPLRELARQFGMSRTPLRAAASRLHQQELLAYNPKIGFTAAVPTAADLYELFDLRLMCETHALERFFDAPEPHRVAVVARLAEEGAELVERILEDPSNFPAFSQRDALFHREIVALSGSRRLLEWYDQVNLRMVIFRLGLTVPFTEDRFRATVSEHQAVAEAMRAGDGGEAARLLRAHVRRVRDQTVERMLRAETAGAADAPRPAWIDRLAAPAAGDPARRDAARRRLGK